MNIFVKTAEGRVTQVHIPISGTTLSYREVRQRIADQLEWAPEACLILAGHGRTHRLDTRALHDHDNFDFHLVHELTVVCLEVDPALEHVSDVPRVVAAALKAGDLNVLMQLFSACNASFDEETCAVAAGYGHVHILQWLRCEGIAWDMSTVMAAARRGHGYALCWAIKHGCPNSFRTQGGLVQESLKALGVFSEN